MIKFHAYTKFIEIQYHHICEVIKKGTVKLRYSNTNEILLIFLQNPLPRTCIKIVIFNLVSQLLKLLSWLLFKDSIQI
jgi:hypothetical protein